jgi:putative phosphoesterase
MESLEAVLARLATADRRGLLVVSDSHGRTDGMVCLAKPVRPFDLVLHLGDLQDDPAEIALELACPVLSVRGNCDTGPVAQNLPDERRVQLGGLWFFLTHGHTCHVKTGLECLLQTALTGSRRPDVVIYGHTHQRRIVRRIVADRPVWLLNPGPAYPGRGGPPGLLLILNARQITIMPLPDLQNP